jgi:hypothetical protein
MIIESEAWAKSDVGAQASRHKERKEANLKFMFQLDYGKQI